MNEYFSGEKLYGNDFSLAEIRQWYEAEVDGYANLGSKDTKTYYYGYHAMNKIHGFDKIKGLAFNNVLGIGSAWGHEFQPVADRINNLTILEPSDNLVSNKIGSLKPTYVKPNMNGQLDFGNDSFDLITCFMTLHHIPNVSFVLKEIVRVLKPGGYLLLSEPIVTMGDWRKPRKGLTKNERGIPVSFFDSEFKGHPLQIISKEYCYTATAFMQKTIGQVLKKPIYSYMFYVMADKYISRLLCKRVRYHPTKKIDKLAPSSIFFVIKKLFPKNVG
jgi:2-polyprenyl-3-methyl-5-hydroxy-6-metoxy-1,4-benzoquinol methylase